MAVNQHHIEELRGCAIIPPGESLLMRCENVELSFSNMSQPSPLFKNPKKGKLYLTPYRVIFVASYPTKDSVVSFMVPFNLMRDCSVEQPTFGANYLKGIISAAPDGGWEGEATFRLTFRSGGAIEFGRLMMLCASNAAEGLPPPVTFFGFSPEASIFFAANLPRVPLGATQLIYVMPNNSPYMPTPPGYQMATTSAAGVGIPLPGFGPPPPGYGPPPHGLIPPPPGYVPGYVHLPAGYGAPLLNTEPRHFPVQGSLPPRSQTLTLPAPKPLPANQNPETQVRERHLDRWAQRLV
ncbi:LOW QUALITY PROTEIN: postacrosomal sheath WW domain-binding protein [Vombatus ursinus]|uniref:LOW QUALITY PROTEIN: postacrosomal sheath WW domain-binding protein n=1 Tax=Vombatus ursinus TaxID=29139 RepID=UPI000FFD3863|nr:LOW QUALITY PROTEIN: postacrosomal sheath WW domain-binding protein [Vombatus ursinus]